MLITHSKGGSVLLWLSGKVLSSGTQNAAKGSVAGDKIMRIGKATLSTPLKSGTRRIFDELGKKEPL